MRFLKELVSQLLKGLADQCFADIGRLLASPKFGKLERNELFTDFESEPRLDEDFIELFLPLIQLKLYSRSVFGLLFALIGPEQGFGTGKMFNLWLAASIKNVSGLKDIGSVLYHRLLFNGWLDSSAQFLSEQERPSGLERFLNLFPPSFKKRSCSRSLTRAFFLRVKQIKCLGVDFLTVDSSFIGSFISSGVAYLLSLPHASLILVQDCFSLLIYPWLYNLVGKPVERLVFDKQLYCIVMKAYCHQEQKRLFNQLMALPHSSAYFSDMRACILTLHRKPRFQTPQILAEIQEKLLVPTTPTTSLVEFFFKAIIGVSYLDDSGVLLEWLLKPLRAAITARPDGLGGIVNALLEKDFNKPLHDLPSLDHCLRQAGFHSAFALRKPIVAPCLDFKRRKVVTEDGELKWLPPSNEASAALIKAQSTHNSAACLLASMIPDQEEMRKEIHASISRHILQNPTVESLDWLDNKLDAFETVFDEKCTRSLRIIRNDLARSHDDAKRFRETHTEGPEFFAIDASKLGWPEWDSANLRLPSSLQRHFDVYSREYNLLRPNQSLDWDHMHSSADINLELPSGPVSLRVSLFQAAVISEFVDQPKWNAIALGSHLDLSYALLEPLLDFWVEKGALVRLSSGDYHSWDSVPAEETCIHPCTSLLVADETDDEDLSDFDDIEESKASLSEELFQELDKKCFMLLQMLMNRAPETAVKPDFLYHNINKFRSPADSFVREVPMATFCNYLEKLVEKKMLVHAYDEAAMYLLPRTAR
ncbi:hypothetical protein DSO57_1023345 [Entomophthora muscae]|uniref:Uncharacterized protein n=1 Tax=Entomophthora muscae TaxID=34485 RepID=A0ACC2RHJ7_9FUNG|nr:hypothetical protein DSO57_1023345 [Entomophthora muscae]